MRREGAKRRLHVELVGEEPFAVCSYAVEGVVAGIRKDMVGSIEG